MGKPEWPAPTVNRTGAWSQFGLGQLSLHLHPASHGAAPLRATRGQRGRRRTALVPGSQPTQCNTLGLARGSGPFEPPTGGSAPLAPPSPPPLPSPSSMTEASMAPEATATRVMQRFGEAFDHNGEGAPSERKALGWLKSRATPVRHRGFLGGALVRLHRLDPRRRKSSIISRPLEAGVSCSTWSIFSTATLRTHGVRPSPNRHRRWPDAGKPLRAGPFPWLGWPKHQERPGRGREVAGLKRPQILEQSGLLGGACPRADGGLGPSNGAGFRWTPGSMLAKMARSGTSSRYRNRFGQWEHSSLSTTSIG